MALVGLLLLLQYFDAGVVLVVLFGMLIVFGIITLVCLWLARSSQEERKRRDEIRRSETPVYSYPPSRGAAQPWAREDEEEAPVPSRGFSRSSGTRNWSAADSPSSPVGGTCLACGSRVTEETSPTCAKCGVDRQRCPVCQRYVAGGQDLLACVHCQTLGHANEMLAWVEQHQTCPYCARRIDADELRPRQDLPRIRRRKS